MSKKEANIILQKAELGKQKAGFHVLPPQNHVYGKAPQKDQFGARQVVSGWQQHIASTIKNPDKNFVAMNKEGARQGCVNAKDFTSFRKDNQIKVKVKEGQKYIGISIPTQQFTYGIPNRPSTPIKNVICNTYAQTQNELRQQREAVLKMINQDKKKIPEKFEVKHKQHKEPDKKKEGQEYFKLSKFKNVQSKVKAMMSPNKK